MSHMDKFCTSATPSVRVFFIWRATPSVRVFIFIWPLLFPELVLDDDVLVLVSDVPVHKAHVAHENIFELRPNDCSIVAVSVPDGGALAMFYPALAQRDLLVV